MNRVALTLLTIIFTFSLFLHFYKLDVNPPGLFLDEITNGYSAYSLLKTGKDYWGVTLPLFSRHFNDYKSEIYPYASVLPISIFGLNAFAVRFASAITGSFAVLAFYFLIVKYLEINNFLRHKEYIGLIGCTLFTINPWCIQLSRYGHEGSLAFFLMIISLALLFVSLADQKKLYFLIANVIGLISVYAYQSERLAYPIFILVLWIMYRNKIKFLKKYFWIIFLLNLLCLLPLVFYQLNGALAIREKQVSIFFDAGYKADLSALIREDRINPQLQFLNNQFFYYSEMIFRQTVKQLSTTYLFLGEGEYNYVLTLKNYGKLLYVEIIFIPLGLLFLYQRNKKLVVNLLSFIFIGCLPVIFTGTSPGSVRGTIILPGLLIFASLGIYYCATSLPRKRILPAVCILYLVNFSLYFHFYFVHFPERADVNWLSFYKTAFEYLKINEKKYDKIIFTPHYGFPHICLFFYEQINPVLVQQKLYNYIWDYTNFNYPDDYRYSTALQWTSDGDIISDYNNYSFRMVNWSSDIQQPNSLIIDYTDHEADSRVRKIFTIYANNGDPDLYFFETKNDK